MNGKLIIACVPLVLLLAFIAVVVSIFGNETLAGASQISLIVATAVCLGIGLLRKDTTWSDFEQTLSEKMGSISGAVIILLLIGALGGSWMVSGIVPTLIYYGMQVMSPEWFLVSACLICALVSIITGSSWTTIATIGVALIGIGQAIGYDIAWTAGAIISGAYFGDKISPLSDTTILASSTVGTPLFTHIRYMLYTTIPTFTITIIIFLIKGLDSTPAQPEHMQMVVNALQHTFFISPWLLLVPILTGVLITMRMPSMVVLFLATLMGTLVAVFTQGALLDEIAGTNLEGFSRRLRGAMIVLYGNTNLETGVPHLNELVATRGMAGMLDTVWLIICAMLFGAAMTATGMLDTIMKALIRMVRGVVSLVASTAFTGVFLNVVASDQYLSILLTATMFGPTYKRYGLEPRLLSRTCEDSATVTSVLVPWNTCGMTQSTVLGVSTLVYAPFCFFCYLSPIMTVVAATFLKKKYSLSPNPSPVGEGDENL